MKLFKAQEEDSENIKSFYSEQVLTGVFDYRINRPNSFFDQYRLATDDFSTYLLTDADEQIQAMASVIFRKGYLNHQEQSIGYVTDLRVSPSRRAILHWAQLFMPKLKQEMASHDCHHLFSSLQLFENQAYNALIRPRIRKSHLPRYHLFRKFHLIAIVGRSPFRTSPIRTIDISNANDEDIEPICDYLKVKNIRRPLYFNVTPEELQRRCQQWPGFSIENFLLARNAQGDIIGCMAPWNNSQVQQWNIDRYHGKSMRVFQTVKPMSFLRLAKPFPKKGETLDMQFITHGEYDNPDIFYALLDRAYENTRRPEVIVYSNYNGDYQTRPPKGFYHIKIPYALYTLLKGEQLLPSFLTPNPFIPPPQFNFVHT